MRRKTKTALILLVCLLLETLLLAVVGLYGAMYIAIKGPSATAKNLFVCSVMETSALKFIPGMYLKQEEVTDILEGNSASAIPLFVPPKTETPAEDSEIPAAETPVDEDGDGILLDEIKGETYSGYMMTVLDPTRVILACNPDKFGVKGNTVEGFVKDYGAVAGVNGGAFSDPGGKGNGSIPMGMVVYEGEVYNSYALRGFVGLDEAGKLYVNIRSATECIENHIRYGVSFGPALVSDGQITEEATKNSGLNPRTAIGQRADGAILLLVIDGRQTFSLGATFEDEAEIMLDFGAVNALNLDGGSSTMMWYNDGYINNSASVVGIRNIPTAFVVLPEKEG